MEPESSLPYSQASAIWRKHLAHEHFITEFFSRGGVVSASPNPQAGGPPLVGCPRPLFQFIRSYPPYRRPFLHPQPDDAPCRGDRDPQTRPVSPNTYIYTKRMADMTLALLFPATACCLSIRMCDRAMNSPANDNLSLYTRCLLRKLIYQTAFPEFQFVNPQCHSKAPIIYKTEG